MNNTELEIGNRPFRNVSEGAKNIRKWLLTFQFTSTRIVNSETEELIREMAESFAESLQCRFATNQVDVIVEQRFAHVHNDGCLCLPASTVPCTKCGAGL
jgi:hypothetical protein